MYNKSFVDKGVSHHLLSGFLSTASLFTNKYVLSVLGFTYPTVFQGWQTFVSVVILRCVIRIHVTPIDRSELITLLPHFILYLGGIVAGSKALSAVPVPVYLSITNVAPAFTYLWMRCNTGSPGASKPVQTIASLMCICFAALVFLSNPILLQSGATALWILTHTAFILAQGLYSSKLDVLYNYTDKLYYSNIFSVILLAPSSFYLEEAFNALHFQHRLQMRFLLGCALSGVFGTFASLYISSTSSTRVNSLAVSRAGACLLSPFVFHDSFTVSAWIFILLNMGVSILVPSNVFITKVPAKISLDDNVGKQTECV